MITIPLSEIAALWDKPETSTITYWAISCEKGHNVNWHDEGWSEEDCRAKIEFYPFCEQDGTKKAPKQVTQEWWSPPRINNDREEAFLRKYLPEYLEGQPE